MTGDNRIPIGVSACLTGEPVRYDGTDKRHASVVGPLAQKFRLIPFCPETIAGLPTPRPPIHLTACNNNVRAIVADGRRDDVTDDLIACANQIMRNQGRLGGMVVKNGSPSCALCSTQLWRNGVVATSAASGVFTTRITQKFPELPLVDEFGLDENIAGFIAAVERHWRNGL